MHRGGSKVGGFSGDLGWPILHELLILYDICAAVLKKDTIKMMVGNTWRGGNG